MTALRKHREQRVLSLLTEHGPMTDADIAGRLGMTARDGAESIADYTAHLARRGLIEPGDASRWQLCAPERIGARRRAPGVQPPEFGPAA